MSDLDDRSSGRRKGLFRRNRTEEFSTPAPWEPGDWDAPVEEEVLDAAPLTEAPRRRTTGDMFAQRDRGWTDAWGDDAWDDEWRDPAFRRVSIPGAVTAQPADVDAWLDDDADNWSDITRETASRWGGMAPDATGPVVAGPAVAEPSVAEHTVGDQAAGSEPAPPVPVVTRAARTTSPQSTALLDDPVERALATVQHTSIDLTDRDQESVDALVSQSIDLPESRTSGGSAAARGRFRRTRTEAPVRVTPLAAETDSAQDDAAGEQAAHAHHAEQIMTSTAVTGIAAAAPGESDDAWDDAAGPLATVTGPAHREVLIDDIEPTDDAEPLDSGARRVGRREAAFSDRATWIGAMVAGLAAVRLLFSVASGMRAADPAGSDFSFFTRIGRGFATLGVTQGALLVLAVVLISLPALVDPRASRRFDGRIASGLGITLGGAVVSLLGALLAWSTQRHLANLAGSDSGSTSTQLLGELIATGGLCLVAFAGALRALRAFHD